MYRTLKIARRMALLLVVGALALLVEPYRYFSLLYAIMVFRTVFKLMRRVLPHVTRA
jgi:hypothetical protein